MKVIPSYTAVNVLHKSHGQTDRSRVDDVFRAVCCNSDALRQIMEDEPYLAKEILLALLIKAKHPKALHWHDEDYSLIPGRGLALVDDSLFYPRFYTRGPFLLFLNTNAQVALETFITLIDFATNRWVAAQSEKQRGSMGIELDLASGQKLLVGDADVFSLVSCYIGITPNWIHINGCGKMVL